MKTAVFFNNKGGVGKTTLTCNVVSFLNMHKCKRVLLIDADPQCNATQAVLEEDLLQELYLSGDNERPPYKTLFDYLAPLKKGEPAIDTAVTPVPARESSFATDLIPGHPKMSLIEDQLSQAWGDLLGRDRVRGFRISNWLSQLFTDLQTRYDLVVFDVGPSLGALNRTVLLSCDYVITPFGSDIFSLLGIQNISSWINSWSDDYSQAIAALEAKEGAELHQYPAVRDTSKKFRFAGYSVQQYVTRRFKTGRRPVKAYEEIMQMIPETVTASLGRYTAPGLDATNLELGHIPFLYSLVPLAQSNRVPIHALVQTRSVAGAQGRQVSEYIELMGSFCDRLLHNVGLSQ